MNIFNSPGEISISTCPKDKKYDFATSLYHKTKTK